MDTLTSETSRAVLLTLHVVRFVVAWFGWRKWLRANGYIDFAFGADGVICGTETDKSIGQFREYVFSLESEWLRLNTNELLAAKGDVKFLYDASLSDSSSQSDGSYVDLDSHVPSVEISPIIRALVRSLLADLDDLTERRRFVTQRVHVSVENRSQFYSYDYTLCTFLDETVELMLRALEFSYSEKNEMSRLFSSLPSDPSPITSSLNFRLLVPFHVLGREALIDVYSRSKSDFFDNFGKQLFQRVPLDEQVLALTNPEVRNFAVIAAKEEVPFSILLSQHFQHSLIGRSHARSLLRVTYETVSAKSVLVAGVLNSGRVGSTNVIADTLVRAARVGVLAVYRLTYSYRLSEQRPETPSTVETELTNIRRTLKDMGPQSEWFPLNGYEQVTALSLASHRLLFSDSPATADYSATRMTLTDVTWFEDYVNLFKESVGEISSDLDRQLVLLSTSVLLDVATLFAEVRSAGSCVSSPIIVNRGMFLRHNRYSQMALVLLPAEVAPAYDRFIIPSSLLCPKSTSSSSSNHAGRKYRLCLAFPISMLETYRTAVTQIGIASIVADLINYFFPRALDVIGSGNADNVAPDSPNVQNVLGARVRALLAKVLSFDQFQATSPTRSEVKLASVGQQMLRNVVTTNIVCCSKLWQFVRRTPSNVRTYVRSQTSVYSPFYSARFVQQTTCGMRPLTAVSRFDTWKSYSYVRPVQHSLQVVNSFNTYTNCRVLIPASDAPCNRRPVKRKYVDLFEEADSLIAGEKLSTEETGCSSTTCDVVFGQMTNQKSVLVCVADKFSNNWAVHRFRDQATFDQFVALYKETTNVDIDRESVHVNLLGWYIDHYSFGNQYAPIVTKVLSKRVYLINGFLAFFETPTKIVSVEPERISNVGRGFKASPRNFVNYNVDLRDEVCFKRPVMRTDSSIQLPDDHFYNRVYRPMYEQNVNEDKTECTLRQPSSFYYTIDLFGVVIWFPTAILLQSLVREPTHAICYDPAPLHLVPLLAHFASAAATENS